MLIISVFNGGIIIFLGPDLTTGAVEPSNMANETRSYISGAKRIMFLAMLCFVMLLVYHAADMVRNVNIKVTRYAECLV